MTATGRKPKHLAFLRRFLSISFPLVVLLTVCDGLADEVIDSGWIDFDPSELEKVYDGERITFQPRISENPAVQTDALRVLLAEITATNKTEDRIFFDISFIGVNSEGEILFVFNLIPNMYRISAKQTTTLRLSKYVLPGTLKKVTKYRVRFLGFE